MCQPLMPSKSEEDLKRVGVGKESPAVQQKEESLSSPNILGSFMSLGGTFYGMIEQKRIEFRENYPLLDSFLKSICLGLVVGFVTANLFVGLLAFSIGQLTIYPYNLYENGAFGRFFNWLTGNSEPSEKIQPPASKHEKGVNPFLSILNPGAKIIDLLTDSSIKPESPKSTAHTLPPTSSSVSLPAPSSTVPQLSSTPSRPCTLN